MNSTQVPQSILDDIDKTIVLYKGTFPVSKFPWIESDIADMEHIKNLLEQGLVRTAWACANNLDTLVRDYFSNDTWDYMRRNR